MSRLVIDIETDSTSVMDVKNVWCVVIKDIDQNKITTYTQQQLTSRNSDFFSRLKNAYKIIGHNILGYDLLILKRLYELEIHPNQVVDTLLVSRLLEPDRDDGHSLESWGKRLGYPKIEYEDFTKFTVQMLDYCINDVNLTEKLFKYFESEIEQYNKSLELEHWFAHIIGLQTLNGFRIDLDKVNNLYSELEKESNEIITKLKTLMPPVKDEKHFQECIDEKLLLSVNDRSYVYRTRKSEQIKEKLFRFTESNPRSRDQIIDFFKKKYKWEPKVFTDKGNPKMDEDILSTLEFSEAKLFHRLFRLDKQKSMIKNGNGGWLNYLKGDRIHGSVITIGTSTSRCAHNSPNMAQVDKKDIRMRQVWVPRKNWKLMGADAKGLELRMLAHYLNRYDQGAYGVLVTGDDIHTENKNIIGLQNRELAKTFIYALIYGGGNLKLGYIVSEDLGIPVKININLPWFQDEELKKQVESDIKLKSELGRLIKLGKESRTKIEDNLTGYKELTEDIKKVLGAKGILKGIDGRPLHPRKEYSALNLLIQSAGAIICKKWLVEWYKELTKLGYNHGEDYAFVANVHDEIQLEYNHSLEALLKELSKKAIKTTEKELGVKVSLDIDIKTGENWGETH